MTFYHIPSQKNERFIGRTNVLENIQQAMFIKNQHKRVAISGLGGIGKTQVALQLAYWTKVNMIEYSVIWVSAVSTQDFDRSYGEIMQFQPDRRSALNDEEDTKQAVKRFLSSAASGPWLLIVDSMDNKDTTREILEFLPRKESGLFIFTTRSYEVALILTSHGGFVEEMEMMNEEDARALIYRSLQRPDILRKDAAISELLDELKYQEVKYLPLAIIQATAYLNRNRTTTLSKYLGRLRSTEEELVELLSRGFDDDTETGSRKAVATTWLASFNQIRVDDEFAAQLLAFLSCIEHKAIPHSILPHAGSEVQMDTSIGTLSAYGFISTREDAAEVYDMHRLVQLGVKIWIQRNNLTEEARCQAIQHISRVFPVETGHDKRSVWSTYLPHAFSTLEKNHVIKSKDNLTLSLRVGQCLLVDGRIKGSLRCLESCNTWSGLNFAVGDPERLEIELLLAQAYFNDGRAEQAISILSQIDNMYRLNAETFLGKVHCADGQVKVAIRLLERVVSIWRRTRADDHRWRIDAEHELAKAYAADGQTGNAIPLLEQVIKFGEAAGYSETCVQKARRELSQARTTLHDPQPREDEAESPGDTIPIRLRNQ
ncbi:hypothetical protein K461DRAFT_254873 [Myriangium duriaei CBS 260.36]|uniref:NB-ARC domain-containing protein n=1 Tax=Myriangium duriaei CBS 260.36 TaxID=1168546 RepID=A0A9P4J0E9_9PEZI|nr:hypothetical protein K461DRAFT_254873 [Myriangium duriaei CBS 260.36]